MLSIPSSCGPITASITICNTNYWNGVHMSLPKQTYDFLCTQRKRRISVNFSIFGVDFKEKELIHHFKIWNWLLTTDDKPIISQLWTDARVGFWKSNVTIITLWTSLLAIISRNYLEFPHRMNVNASFVPRVICWWVDLP